MTESSQFKMNLSAVNVAACRGHCWDIRLELLTRLTHVRVFSGVCVGQHLQRDSNRFLGDHLRCVRFILCSTAHCVCMQVYVVI